MKHMNGQREQQKAVSDDMLTCWGCQNEYLTTLMTNRLCKGSVRGRLLHRNGHWVSARPPRSKRLVCPRCGSRRRKGKAATCHYPRCRGRWDRRQSARASDAAAEEGTLVQIYELSLRRVMDSGQISSHIFVHSVCMMRRGVSDIWFGVFNLLASIPHDLASEKKKAVMA